MSELVESRFEKARAALQEQGIELFDYQVEGVKWMIEHELNPKGILQSTGGLLCDDPGLGKTLQTVALMMANPVSKTLIVCPISLIEQWRLQIKKAWPEAKIQINDRNGLLANYNDIKRIKDHDVIITGYSRVWATDREQNYMKTIIHTTEWGRVVLDECHTIRNKKSKVFQGCFDLKAKYRWGLSGTPLQNKIDDLKSLFQFIHMPHHAIVNNLDMLLERFIMRRNKSLVAEKYKNLKVNVLDIPFDTDKEREFYVKVEEEVQKEYLKLINEGETPNMMEIFELLLRLRQATIHPNLVIKGLAKKFDIKKPQLWKGSSTKINKMMELFANQEEDDRSLVVCHYQEEIDQALIFLGRAFPKLRMEVFNGGLSLEARNDLVRRCMKGEVDVLFMQIMAGGVGLNLQIFNKVFLLTPNWNPGNEIQAIARCHRIGQTRDVEVFKIVIRDDVIEKSTIDERIIEVQIEKRDLMVSSLNDETFKFNEQFKNSNGLKAGGCGFTLRDMKKLLCM